MSLLIVNWFNYVIDTDTPKTLSNCVYRTSCKWFRQNYMGIILLVLVLAATYSVNNINNKYIFLSKK